MDRVVRRELPDAPVEALLVIDATTGQNGLAQAREFKAAVALTGVVLTKLDGTARGGIVVPITQELGVPVKLVGLGEGLDDLEPFDPGAFVDALLAPAAASPAGIRTGCLTAAAAAPRRGGPASPDRVSVLCGERRAAPRAALGKRRRSEPCRVEIHTRPDGLRRAASPIMEARSWTPGGDRLSARRSAAFMGDERARGTLPPRARNCDRTATPGSQTSGEPARASHPLRLSPATQGRRGAPRPHRAGPRGRPGASTASTPTRSTTTPSSRRRRRATSSARMRSGETSRRACWRAAATAC